jgi:periplasmic divalent cation tolerance protein
VTSTVYITVPEREADRIARALVKEELAACVNAVDCRSTYRWEGEVHTEPETVLLAKTTDDRYPDLRDRLEELHPHEVPCIERFEAADVAPDFGAWIDDSVR